MFVIAIVFAVLALLALGASFFIRMTAEVFNSESRAYETQRSKTPNTILRLVAAGLGFVAILFLIFSSFFRQDVGQATVLRDWTGAVVGSETTEGLHAKAPWVDTITFDIRNQRVVYTGGASVGDNSGGEADGPQITVQDREGVSSNVDITITYSIDPSAVIDIYRAYGTEESLRAKLIFNDIRSIVRDVPGNMTTLEVLTKRGDFAAEVYDKLEAKWEKDGLIVNDVALQEIRPPEAVVASYAAAQQAQIDVDKATAELESATVRAQQQVAEAQAQADSNAILAASLTPTILQQRYLDTLSKLAAAGNLVVVPEGFNGLVNVSK